MTDVIVVGSGASAVHAAWPLVEAGLSVLMLDVGYRDHVYEPLIPDKPFEEIRRTDPEQHRYFLGDRFEGVTLGSVRVGAQLTPPRAFIRHGTDELTPIESERFAGMESLARGGLASGWGAGVARFTDEDLARTPLRAADLAPHYAAVEERIGVCGEDDDLSEELGRPASMMPALRIDDGSRRILERYSRSHDRYVVRGLRLGAARLAACSRTHRGRGPHRYDDLDFWADKDAAVYRPRWTLEELAECPNFTRMHRRLVLRFDERPSTVRVTCRNIDTGENEVFEAGRLVLAAGVFGTARIVLRSLSLYDRPIPFVANPYTYAPCINTMMLGRQSEAPRHSLTQIMGAFRPEIGARPLHISIYSYRSLLTFKLMKEAPISVAAARPLMQALIPAITILGIHHPDHPTLSKHMLLRRDPDGGPDRLAINYELQADESARIERHERALLSVFRSLGCWAIKRINPGHGSSIHYAGSFPMSEAPRELQTGMDGLLHGTRAVHLADGSWLPDLPAKGLTLTLMAGADRIGTLIARSLRA